ncbi:MAG: hypothetical protein JW704_09165 [Anaerolineaceae bacterium]|nr:hypothetical protein [Anaerolineaceae bacterium]
MKIKGTRSIAIWTLISLHVFLGLGALATGALLILKPDGNLLQMPLSLIAGSPFPDFFIPGLIMFLLMGVYPTGIAYGIWKRPDWKWPDAINPFNRMHWRWVGSLVVGLIVIIWLTVELMWVEWFFLHGIYYIWSALIILLTLTPAVQAYLRRNQ